MKYDFYIAAPLFTDYQRDFNNDICKKLELKYTVFLPQRDGVLLPDLNARGLSHSKAVQQIFSADIEAILASRGILAVIDGPEPDVGVAFELGFGFAKSKKLYALISDFRLEVGGFLNPMLEASFHQVFSNLDDLDALI